MKVCKCISGCSVWWTHKIITWVCFSLASVYCFFFFLRPQLYCFTLAALLSVHSRQLSFCGKKVLKLAPHYSIKRQATTLAASLWMYWSIAELKGETMCDFTLSDGHKTRLQINVSAPSEIVTFKVPCYEKHVLINIHQVVLPQPANSQS